MDEDIYSKLPENSVILDLKDFQRREGFEATIAHYRENYPGNAICTVLDADHPGLIASDAARFDVILRKRIGAPAEFLKRRIDVDGNNRVSLKDLRELSLLAEQIRAIRQAALSETARSQEGPVSAKDIISGAKPTYVSGFPVDPRLAILLCSHPKAVAVLEAVIADLDQLIYEIEDALGIKLDY